MPGPYRTILLDPPWAAEAGGGGRGAQNHYPLVKTRDLPALILGSPEWDPADDAHCYLWVTNATLKEGIWLLEELGFRYVTNVVWVKTRATIFDPKDLKAFIALALEGRILEAFRSLLRYGLGQYFRGGHELMLFGVRGDGLGIRTDRRDLCGVIVAPLGRHSAKPEESYELIEARSPGPRVEFFCRTPRPGWDRFGNEVVNTSAEGALTPAEDADA